MNAQIEEWKANPQLVVDYIGENSADVFSFFQTVFPGSSFTPQEAFIYQGWLTSSDPAQGTSPFFEASFLAFKKMKQLYVRVINEGKLDVKKDKDGLGFDLRKMQEAHPVPTCYSTIEVGVNGSVYDKGVWKGCAGILALPGKSEGFFLGNKSDWGTDRVTVHHIKDRELTPLEGLGNPYFADAAFREQMIQAYTAPGRLSQFGIQGNDLRRKIFLTERDFFLKERERGLRQVYPQHSYQTKVILQKIFRVLGVTPSVFEQDIPDDFFDNLKLKVEGTRELGDRAFKELAHISIDLFRAKLHNLSPEEKSDYLRRLFESTTVAHKPMPAPLRHNEVLYFPSLKEQVGILVKLEDKSIRQGRNFHRHFFEEDGLPRHFMHYQNGHFHFIPDYLIFFPMTLDPAQWHILKVMSFSFLKELFLEAMPLRKFFIEGRIALLIALLKDKVPTVTLKNIIEENIVNLFEFRAAYFNQEREQTLLEELIVFVRAELDKLSLLNSIHVAAMLGDLYFVRDALDQANKEQKWKGKTPLHLAAEFGHAPLVKFLLEEGAEKNTKGDDGMTPLIGAAKNGQLEGLKVLAERGADLSERDSGGMTPLMWAAKEGHSSVVEYLIRMNAEVEAENLSKKTPLIYAAINGHLEVVQFLVASGAYLEAMDHEKVTPFLWASTMSHLPIVQFLKEQGANIDHKNISDMTALLMAVLKGDLEMTRYLVELGADIEAKHKRTFTPLLMAALKGHGPVLQYLVLRGGDKEARAENGMTALLIAASKGFLPLVRFLVDHGADRRATDNSSKSAMDLAREKGHTAIVEYLQSI